MAYPVDDGRDELLKCLDICVLRQACKDVVEVDAGILVHHLDKHLEEDGPSQFAGLVRQMGRSVGLELLESVNDALEEHGHLGARRHSVVGGIPEVRQAHG